MCFIGYSATQKGYKLYHLPTRRFLVRLNVTFRKLKATLSSQHHLFRENMDNEQLKRFLTFGVLDEYEKDKTGAPKREDALDLEARVLDELVKERKMHLKGRMHQRERKSRRMIWSRERDSRKDKQENLLTYSYKVKTGQAVSILYLTKSHLQIQRRSHLL